VHRTLVSAILAVVVAVPLGAVPLATGASARRSAAPACATSKLVVWMNTSGNGAAGTVYYALRFTNLSGHTCTLRGFPGVSAVSLAAHQLGSAAARDHATPVKTISIANGHTATAILGIVEAGNFPTPKCGPTTAAGLRIYPPNQTASKLVPFPFAACSQKGPVFLRIRTVT
jgi:Domain of unknown function (DUF4232)